MQIPREVQKAFEIAKLARSRAHAPYSKFKVGAALKVAGVEQPFGGCNVENASYGGTLCAERTAVVSAVAALGSIRPEFLLVITNEPKATVPCAFCLQVLAEFCGDEMPIYLANEQGVLDQKVLKEFLPFPFRVFEAK